MVEFIIGDYSPKATETVVDRYNPAFIFKHKLDSLGEKPVVIFGEYAGITADDCKAIAKSANRDIKIVLQSNKMIKGIRQGKKVKITYDGGTANASIFEIASAVMKLSDRDYVFNFLKVNKPQMYMLVKALIAAYDVVSQSNRQIVAWLDMHQWKVNPEILYAVMAYKIKPQPSIKWLPWKFPKKMHNLDE